MADSKQDMDFEEMKYKYYFQLKDKTCIIQSSGKYFLCSFCNDPNRKDYKLGELMQHASRVGSESKSATLKEKAKHLGLLKYLEKKINKTYVFLSNVMDQQDKITNDYNTEMKKMEQMVAEELHDICIRHEHGKMHLENRRKKLEMLEKDLELREELNESVKRSLSQQKDMNEMAILEQKKANQDLLKLAEEQMREKESLYERIIELEANLDQKQALELEIERLKGAVEIMVHMNEACDIEAIKKKNLIEDELKEKKKEFEIFESLNHKIFIRQCIINDEVHEARKELISGFRSSRAFITVKRMGELEDHAFLIAAKRKFPEEEVPEKIEELCSFWVDQLRDPSWQDAKEIIDEEDEKLSGLRQELGEEVCQAVITALKEINEYNSSGRYLVPELWNSRENRRASLNEGVEYVIKAWRQNKRKRANEVLQQNA